MTHRVSSPLAAVELASNRASTEQYNYDALGTSLWEELVSGRCVVRASSHSATHCVLEVERNATANARRPSDGRRFEYLRRTLIGEAPKAVAYASQCSTSTLAVATGDALSMMGFNRGNLYAPYLLVRAAHVASGKPLPACVVTSGGSSSHFQVSIERPDLKLARVLSTCECAVAGLMLEGYTNDAIALLRGVSARTVANQISSVFGKLGRSGRAQLLCALVEHEGTGWPEKPLRVDASHKSHRLSRHAPRSRRRDSVQLIGHAL